MYNTCSNNEANIFTNSRATSPNDELRLEHLGNRTLTYLVCYILVNSHILMIEIEWHRLNRNKVKQSGINSWDASIADNSKDIKFT